MLTRTLGIITRAFRIIKKSHVVRAAAYTPAGGAAPKPEPPKPAVFGGDATKLDEPVIVLTSSL